MHKVPVDDERSVAVFEAASRHNREVFVLRSAVDWYPEEAGSRQPVQLRFGDPLAVAAVAARCRRLR